jgi:GT2 family glycosyltransferase
MRLSVVIPTFNGGDTIGGQLGALSRQRWGDEWEVVVADNGSTDETRAIVGSYSPRLPLRIVDASQVPGQPHALNVGARSATGDALLFCDDDDEVGEGWLAAMGRALAQHPFVACRIDPYKLNAPWVVESRGKFQWNGLQQIPYPPFLPHAGGGTLGIWRSLFETMGGFDESLLALHDTFLCLRIQLAGVPLHFVPDALVHVRYRHTFAGIYRQAHTYGEYSTLLYRKSRELGTPPLARPVRDSLIAWYSLLRSLPALRRKGGLARWVFSLGYRVGRMKGSLKHRVLAP